VARPGVTHLRLLLLAVLACGVVQMHILGHLSGEHSPPAAEHVMAAPAPAAAAAPDDDGASAPSAPDRPLDPLAVCLAVLTLLSVPVAMVLLWVRRARPVFRRGPRRLTSGIRRGHDPPGSVPPSGRRLAALSVLRI
jgi:hypothetical protein